MRARNLLTRDLSPYMMPWLAPLVGLLFLWGGVAGLMADRFVLRSVVWHGWPAGLRNICLLLWACVLIFHGVYWWIRANREHLKPFLLPSWVAMLFVSAVIFSTELIWPTGVSREAEYLRSAAYRKEIGDIVEEVRDEERRRAAMEDRRFKAELVKLARHHVLTHRPEWREKLALEPCVTENATQYQVTWLLPAGTIGGTPVVIIDKQTRAVVGAYHTQ